MQHLSSNALAKGTADLEFVAKFGGLWGNPRKYKSHTVRYGTGVALTLRCSCGSIQLSVNATVSMQHLSSNALAKGTADLEFVAKFGELWGNPRKCKSHTALRHRCCIDTKVLMWIHSA